MIEWGASKKPEPEPAPAKNNDDWEDDPKPTTGGSRGKFIENNFFFHLTNIQQLL